MESKSKQIKKTKLSLSAFLDGGAKAKAVESSADSHEPVLDLILCSLLFLCFCVLNFCSFVLLCSQSMAFP
jgi:hypothetical protein